MRIYVQETIEARFTKTRIMVRDHFKTVLLLMTELKMLKTEQGCHAGLSQNKLAGIYGTVLTAL